MLIVSLMLSDDNGLHSFKTSGFSRARLCARYVGVVVFARAGVGVVIVPVSVLRRAVRPDFPKPATQTQISSGSNGIHFWYCCSTFCRNTHNNDAPCGIFEISHDIGD